LLSQIKLICIVFYTDVHEILRFPSERKTGISLSEIK